MVFLVNQHWHAHFSVFKRSLGCFSLLLFSLLLCTPVVQGAESEITTKIASIVASPNSCTLDPLEEVCEMTFHLLWETPNKGNYCLFLDDDEDQPISCWEDKKRGSIPLEYFAHILENNKTYLLMDKNRQIIAVVTVPVTGTLKQRQRAQRRRRGFWRMF